MPQPARTQTTGVDALDILIDGVRVGDNVVVMFGGNLGAQWLIDRYLAAGEPGRTILADTSGRAEPIPGVDVLDWSQEHMTSRVAREQLAHADEAVGADAIFAIDSLSTVARRWGARAALDLFLWACPRLFRRRSVALWVLRADEHDDAFVRDLTSVTQVVVRVDADGADGVRLEVLKADGRSAFTVGRALRARLSDGDLVDAQPVDVERQRLAGHLRALRASRGVAQSELARRVGISPSALSQAERGVRAVSAETLVRIWETLGVPVVADEDPGYRVLRRGERAVALATGVTGQRRSDGAALTVWELTFTPRASGRNPLFVVKAVETVLILRGILQLEVAGATETLHEGDTLRADRATVTAWANPADGPTEALWLLETRG